MYRLIAAVLLLIATPAMAEMVSMSVFVYLATETDHHDPNHEVYLQGGGGPQASITPLGSGNVISASYSPLRPGDVVAISSESNLTLAPTPTYFRIVSYAYNVEAGNHGAIAVGYQTGWPLVIITKHRLVGGAPNKLTDVSTQQTETTSAYFTVP